MREPIGSSVFSANCICRSDSGASPSKPAGRGVTRADEKSVAKSRSKLSNTSTPDSVLAAPMARVFHVPLAVSSVPPVLKDHWPLAVRVPVVPTGCIAR